MNPFEQMLAELESSRLEVILVPLSRPANSGGMKRVAISKNVAWYREFCARHESSRGRQRRKPDTKIRRRDVARVLYRLANNLPSVSKYVPELTEIAKKSLHRRPLPTYSHFVTSHEICSELP